MILDGGESRDDIDGGDGDRDVDNDDDGQWCELEMILGVRELSDRLGIMDNGYDGGREELWDNDDDDNMGVFVSFFDF